MCFCRWGFFYFLVFWVLFWFFFLPTPKSLSLDAEHAVGLVKNPTWFHFAQAQAVGLQGLPGTARITFLDTAFYTMLSLLSQDSHNKSDYYSRFAHKKARAKSGKLLL